MKNEFRINTPENVVLAGDVYMPEKSKTSVLVISHGMAEHCARYEEFAHFLCENGIAVYAYDHRGHGRTCERGGVHGFFSEKDGWNKVVEDLNAVVEYARIENPELPIVVLGHSMGSFIARNFAEKYGNGIRGLILSGTAGSSGLLGKIGIFLTKVILLFNKPTSPSKLMNSLSFGAFNKEFKPAKTAFDWLSRDTEKVNQYIADPYCGQIFSIQFFKDLLIGLEHVNSKKHFQAFPKSLPVYLFSGSKDPVSKNAAQIPILSNNYKKYGVRSLIYKIYPEGRHESLNEINRSSVYQDIVNFIKSVL